MEENKNMAFMDRQTFRLGKSAVSNCGARSSALSEATGHCRLMEFSAI